jgi:hypothetical protein
MKKVLLVLSVLFIFSCSQDPKQKSYTEKSLKDDLMLFNDSERELIQTYVVRQTMVNGMSGMFGITDSDKVILNTLSYGEMINSQNTFLNEQIRKDSLKKVEEEKERIEEEKRRIILEQKQDSLSKLVQITVTDIYKNDQSYSDQMCMKIKMISNNKKRVNSLSFSVNVEDKKGNNLGRGSMKNSDSFTNYDSGSWCWSSYNDLYSILNGSSVDDYHYSYEIRSMIYDGELIELE